MSPEEELKNAEKRVLEGKTYFWIRDTMPVCMAAQARPTANGLAINGVFTPAEHHCRGYASALVGAVSQMSLDSGKKFCTLYTDLDNPTSNSIYQKIGYTSRWAIQPFIASSTKICADHLQRLGCRQMLFRLGIRQIHSARTVAKAEVRNFDAASVNDGGMPREGLRVLHSRSS